MANMKIRNTCNKKKALVYREPIRKELTFIKEETNKWYAVIPDWDGSKEDLEMIRGADDMLDILSHGETIVETVITDTPRVTTKFELQLKEIDEAGATYVLRSELHTFRVWLCNVTKYIFGFFPATLYIN